MNELTKSQRDVIKRLVALPHARRVKVRDTNEQVVVLSHAQPEFPIFANNRIIEGGADWDPPACATCDHRPRRYAHAKFYYERNAFKWAELNGMRFDSITRTFEVLQVLMARNTNIYDAVALADQRTQAASSWS